MSGPDVWGPHGWKFIHFVTLGYPNHPTKNDKEIYKNFFKTLRTVIPCSICADNYKKHLLIKPLTDDILNDRIKLIKWGITMHNLVNLEHNKKIMTFDEGIEKILDCTHECRYIETYEKKSEPVETPDPVENHKDKIYFVIPAIILLIFLLYQYIKK